MFPNEMVFARHEIASSLGRYVGLHDLGKARPRDCIVLLTILDRVRVAIYSFQHVWIVVSMSKPFATDSATKPAG